MPDGGLLLILVVVGAAEILLAMVTDSTATNDTGEWPEGGA